MYSHFLTPLSATLNQGFYVSVQYCLIYSTGDYHSLLFFIMFIIYILYSIICVIRKKAKHEERGFASIYPPIKLQIIIYHYVFYFSFFSVFALIYQDNYEIS